MKIVKVIVDGEQADDTVFIEEGKVVNAACKNLKTAMLLLASLRYSGVDVKGDGFFEEAESFMKEYLSD